MTEVCSAGFPHSDICGSVDICSSPQLFAAYHVFHRLLVPRHPPCALSCLTNSLKAVGNDLDVCCRLACKKTCKSLTNHLRSKGYEIGRRPMNNRFASSSFKLFASSVTLLWSCCSCFVQDLSILPRMSCILVFANFDTFDYDSLFGFQGTIREHRSQRLNYYQSLEIRNISNL